MCKKKMSELPNLPNSIKNLINEGAFELYTIKEGINKSNLNENAVYVLYMRENTYILDQNGNAINTIKDPSKKFSNKLVLFE